MAAKQLCGDADMVPVFGQVLRVECSALKNWYRDSTGPHSVSYVYPRSKDVIFGGTKHEVCWNVKFWIFVLDEFHQPLFRLRI